MAIERTHKKSMHTQFYTHNKLLFNHFSEEPKVQRNFSFTFAILWAICKWIYVRGAVRATSQMSAYQVNVYYVFGYITIRIVKHTHNIIELRFTFSSDQIPISIHTYSTTCYSRAFLLFLIFHFVSRTTNKKTLTPPPPYTHVDKCDVCTMPKTIRCIISFRNFAIKLMLNTNTANESKFTSQCISDCTNTNRIRNEFLFG